MTGKDRTVSLLYQRDKARLTNWAKGFIVETFPFSVDIPWPVRQECAEEAFSRSVCKLLEKYPVLVEENYQRSERVLFGILRNEVRQIFFERSKQRALDRGEIIPFMAAYNARQRGRDRRSYLRKQGKKRYYQLKQDPVKYAAYLDARKARNRQRYQEKKAGTFVDRRRFVATDPYKHMKFVRDEGLISPLPQHI